MFNIIKNLEQAWKAEVFKPFKVGHLCCRRFNNKSEMKISAIRHQLTSASDIRSNT